MVVETVESGLGSALLPPVRIAHPEPPRCTGRRTHHRLGWRRHRQVEHRREPEALRLGHESRRCDEPSEVRIRHRRGVDRERLDGDVVHGTFAVARFAVALGVAHREDLSRNGALLGGMPVRHLHGPRARHLRRAATLSGQPGLAGRRTASVFMGAIHVVQTKRQRASPPVPTSMSAREPSLSRTRMPCRYASARPG